MKKRLRDKKAGIVLLLAIILITIGEMIFRAITIHEGVLNTPNMGEQVSVILFALIILILTIKGKDRACYICYGALVGYFILDQFFELPGYAIGLSKLIAGYVVLPSPVIGIITNISLVLSTICIVAIGVLLVEYMNDGTIFNKAFNILCVITIVLIFGNIVLSVYGAITDGLMEALLATFHDMYRITMVFLFAFFAYDSAKHQLKKANLSK